MKLHELFEGYRSEYAANAALATRPQIRPEIKKIEKDGKVRLKSKKTGNTKGIFNSRKEAELALAKHPERASLVIENIVEEDIHDPHSVQIEKGLSREQALKAAPWKKSYGDCRAFHYDAKTGKATWT